ncbi:MAG: DUF4266 domain-containing protein [bacterium]|nr:DUF4266 domain-containing protein [bacterium]
MLLDFWASWCGPCRQSFPWLEAMRQRYADRGLVVVAVNVDEERADADRFLEGTSYDFEFVYDPEGSLPEAYALEAMPSSILFDRSGKPVYRHSGFRLDEAEAYEKRIVELLETETVAGNYEEGAAAGSDGGGVKPWERGLLAKPEMQLDCDPIDLAFDDHIYFSKEASSGGRGFGGGGCGCN